MNKRELRKKIKLDLAAMDRLQYEQNSYIIAGKLFQSAAWQEANTVAVTISGMPEVDTWQIIRRAWDEGKRVAVPKCRPSTRKMDFFLLTSFQELELAYAGLYEPDVRKAVYIERKQLELIIVPGLGFDEYGFRIGFGGGYYDRFLDGYQGSTIALAFLLQMQNEIVTEVHDFPVDRIITEKDIFHCKELRDLCI